MTAFFSKSCEYAIRAVLFMSQQDNDKRNSLGEIAGAMKIPRHYLSKILQNLVRHNIVRSRKGHNGGFELRRRSEEIKLQDIMRAVEGDTMLDHCVLGFSSCSDINPCPAHSYWKDARPIIQRMLDEKTVEDLSLNLSIKLLFSEVPAS